MSYFIFGTLFFRAEVTGQEQEECSFKAAEIAVREHFSMQMGVNICQSLVKEILEKQCDGDETKCLAFLVTDSPIANTSDGLISPFTVGAVIPCEPKSRGAEGK